MVLAAAVLPTLQLVLPPGQISPLSAPPSPPTTATMAAGRQDMIKYCKSMILPDPAADCLKDCDKRTPTRVLAVAVFCTLEKHLFDETTPRAEIASLFCITAAQLHKAVTGVNSMTLTKLQKTDADSTPAPSTSGNQPSENASAKGATSKTGTSHLLTVSLRIMKSYDKIIPMGGTGAGETPSEDTLSSSSSEELPEVPFQ